MSMTLTVKEKLVELSNDPNLLNIIASIKWKPNMRCRVVLEIDVNPSGEIEVHGFEFRVRKPSIGKTL